MIDQITFEWWTLRPSPHHGYTITEVHNLETVIAAWLEEFAAKAIVLSHNMATLRLAAQYDYENEARADYLNYKWEGKIIS